MAKKVILEIISEDQCKVNGEMYHAKLHKHGASSFTTVRAAQCERCEIEEKSKISCKDMWDKICLKLRCSDHERKTKMNVYYKKAV